MKCFVIKLGLGCWPFKVPEKDNSGSLFDSKAVEEVSKEPLRSTQDYVLC